VATLSIRNHLLLLLVAVSCPLVLVVGFGIYHDLQQDIAHTKASLRTLARTMVNNTGNKLANAQHMLEQMAKRPLVRQLDAARCDEILKDVLALKQGYTNVFYTDLRGKVVCSALPSPDSNPMQVGQYAWFQESLKRQEFTVGAPFLGPITHKWVSVLSAPIWNDSHEKLGTVHLTLDLSAFDPKIPTQLLPEGSRYGFFNDDGIMVWRNLDPEKVIGTRPDAEAARKIVALRDGEFESLAIDGVVRYFSVIPMPQTGWVAFVGVPASSVYAAARQHALMSVLAVLCVLVFLGLLAPAIARRIIRPISQLEQTARAIQAGALDARAVTGGPREISEVAEAFNAMAEQIQSSTRQMEGEIINRKQAEEQVRQMAFYDALTNLPNRRLLIDRLSQTIAASKRNACYGALMFLDLDNFKPLNDKYGHEVGDLLLIEVAQRLTKCVREVDTVARFGGDEFVVILSELDADPATSAAQASVTADKILTALAEPYSLSVKREGQADSTLAHHCTASMGVAMFIDHDVSPESILRWADTAMYQAKEGGRNRVCFYASGMA
jgi:diguanylate cyclase (GGDEF)-like protein